MSSATTTAKPSRLSSSSAARARCLASSVGPVRISRARPSQHGAAYGRRAPAGPGVDPGVALHVEHDGAFAPHRQDAIANEVGLARPVHAEHGDVGGALEGVPQPSEAALDLLNRDDGRVHAVRSRPDGRAS